MGLNIERNIPAAMPATFFIMVMGYSLWRMTFYNYADVSFQLDNVTIGHIFSASSIPGVFSFLLGFVAHYTAYYILTGLSAIILGLGMILLGMATTVPELWIATVSISWGFVWFLSLANNAYIDESAKQTVQLALGRLKSLGPLAAVAATFLIYFTEKGELKLVFWVAGIGTILSSIWLSFSIRGQRIGRKRSRLSLSWSLWPYYLLNLVAGSRSAIFKAFVISQLVPVYGFKSRQIGVAMLFSSLTVIISYRFIGKLASRYPPHNVLTGLYVSVAVLFLGLAYTEKVTIFLVFFFLDSLFFGTAVITDGYLKQVRESSLVAGDLAVGLSFYHLAGVIVPIIAVWLYKLFGQATVLLVGTLVCLAGALVGRMLSVRLVMTQEIKPKRKAVIR